MTQTRSPPAAACPSECCAEASRCCCWAGPSIVAIYRWLGIDAGLQFAIGGVLYDAVVLGAGVACLVRASSYGRERAAWTLIGLAILSWGAAEVYWTAAIDGNASAPYPSPADIGYLAFYPLAYAGLAVLVRARADQLNWRLWMDGAIAALGTAALGAAFVFDFVASTAEGSTLQVATTLAYPLGDILMVAIVVGVVALTGWRPGRTWALLLAGLTALVVADIAYTLQMTQETLPLGELDRPDLPDRRRLPRGGRVATGGGDADLLAPRGWQAPRPGHPLGLRRGHDRASSRCSTSAPQVASRPSSGRRRSPL